MQALTGSGVGKVRLRPILLQKVSTPACLYIIFTSVLLPLALLQQSGQRAGPEATSHVLAGHYQSRLVWPGQHPRGADCARILDPRPCGMVWPC